MVTLRLLDVAAGTAWLVAIFLAVLDTVRPGPPSELAIWAVIAAAAGASITAVAWCSRRLSGYQRGVDAGLRTAEIIKLSDHERL